MVAGSSSGGAMKVGNKVVVGSAKRRGTVVGMGAAIDPYSGEAVGYYLVSLNHGFWSEDQKTYVNIVVSASSDMEEDDTW
jgi:hypothetical protein